MWWRWQWVEPSAGRQAVCQDCVPCQGILTSPSSEPLPPDAFSHLFPLLCSEPSENPALARRAHSTMLTQPFSLYGREAEVDVMLEAKGMEQALLFYRDELQLGRKQETTRWPAAGCLLS